LLSVSSLGDLKAFFGLSSPQAVDVLHSNGYKQILIFKHAVFLKWTFREHNVHIDQIEVIFNS